MTDRRQPYLIYGWIRKTPLFHEARSCLQQSEASSDSDALTVQDRKCWRDSGRGSANDSCGRVIGLLTSDVAKPIPLPQGVMNINTAQLGPLSTDLPFFRLTAMTTLHFPTEWRMYKTMNALLSSQSCPASSFLAPSMALHGSSTID